MWLDDLNEAGKAPLKITLQMVELGAEALTKWWGLVFLALVGLIVLCYVLSWAGVR